MTLQTTLIEFVHNLATGSRKIRNVFTPIGATIFGLLVCGFIIAGLKVDRIVGVERLMPLSVGTLLSLPVFAMAIFMIGWSVHHFLKAKGTPVPANPPPRLVTSGPYRYTRNPMLTGVFALLFGFGILFGSFFLLLVFTPLFIALNFWELKRIEEPELEKRLGRAYIDYRSATPMFFPCIRRKKRKEIK